MLDRAGQQLGNYRLERKLAQGAFGSVYLGEHIHLGMQAAIKVLNTQIASEDVELFRNEARTIARLVHPNIVRILEFGVEGNAPFLVMDYAPNGTLSQRHPKGSQLPPTTIVDYVKQLADALQYAHDNRLIHRDIKPENMLVGRHNEILLSDFGIALIAQSSRYQGTQDVAGTIGYMAPEQIQAHPRPASDQYALGIVVYEWISGERPFHGGFAEIAAKHTTALPPPLREKVPMIPHDVEQVVMTALEKDPQNRFSSVQAFARAFEQACQEHVLTARSDKLYVQPPQQIGSKVLPSSQNLRGSVSDKPDQKPQVTSSDDRTAWTIRIGRPRLTTLVAALVGIVLYSLLATKLYPSAIDQLIDYRNLFINYTSYNLDLLGALAIFGFFEVVPLFFGAAFGSLAGLLVGLIGFIVGGYYSFDFRGFYSGITLSDYLGYYNQYHIWYVLAFLAFVGYTAGFMPRRVQGRLNSLSDPLRKTLPGIAGVLIGVSLLLFISDAFVLHQAAMWQQFLLFEFVLPGVVLLPFVVWAYSAILKRISASRQPVAV